METIKFKEIWETLSKIDCSEHTKTKRTGRDELTYLSWSWAWAELMKRFPEATYTIREWEGKPWLDDPVAGVLVMTEVDIGGNRRPMWLAAMDGANNALKREGYSYFVKGFNGQQVEKKVAAVDMCAINKAIMRCLVKNLAMFGLGINIYAGEDLPVGVEEVTPCAAQPNKSGRTRPPAAQPKEARQRNPKAMECWKAFKQLEDVDKMPEKDRNTYWGRLLAEACGHADSAKFTDEDWDKLLNYLSIVKEM